MGCGRLGVVLVLMGLTAGCGSVPSAPPDASRVPAKPRPAVLEPRVEPAAPDPSLAGAATADRIVRIARSLLAKPYRYAGADPKGFDCSGLTSFVFHKVGLALPRTAERQASAGHWVAPDELAGGDLVFFGEQRDKPMHVGVVVSNAGEPLTMIHSSSSRGVVETEILTNSYWLPRLKFGRRVLE